MPNDRQEHIPDRMTRAASILAIAFIVLGFIGLCVIVGYLLWKWFA